MYLRELNMYEHNLHLILWDLHQGTNRAIHLGNTMHILILLHQLNEVPLSLLDGGHSYNMSINLQGLVSLSAPHR